METPRKGLWVSSLDLERANRGHTRLVYFFDPGPGSSTGADDFFDPSRLKEAMAKALVAFYPLAGRVGVDGDGRTQIDCNSEGALFVVARSELRLDDLDDLKPSPELRRLFVPRIEPSSILLAVQVTFMKCGGVVLGTAFHHVAVDAMGDFHFMQTWSAFSRDGDGAAVELPCHQHTLLRARSPPVVHPDALSVLYRPKMTSSSSSHHHRCLRHLQRPARVAQAHLRRRERILRRRRPRVAVRLCRTASAAGRRNTRLLLSRHPPPRRHEASPSGPLPRQRHHYAVRRWCGP